MINSAPRHGAAEDVRSYNLLAEFLALLLGLPGGVCGGGAVGPVVRVPLSLPPVQLVTN